MFVALKQYTGILSRAIALWFILLFFLISRILKNLLIRTFFNEPQKRLFKVKSILFFNRHKTKRKKVKFCFIRAFLYYVIRTTFFGQQLFPQKIQFCHRIIRFRYINSESTCNKTYKIKYEYQLYRWWNKFWVKNTNKKQYESWCFCSAFLSVLILVRL